MSVSKMPKFTRRQYEVIADALAYMSVSTKLDQTPEGITQVMELLKKTNEHFDTEKFKARFLAAMQRYVGDAVEIIKADEDKECFDCGGAGWNNDGPDRIKCKSCKL